MVLIDTGPIVALFDESEPAHELCKEILKKMRRPLLTSWPVLTEAFYLLGDWKKGQEELWNFLLQGGFTIGPIRENHYSRLKELMEKYSDRPMDLADASLVLLSEISKTRTIFTLDKSDFSIYRSAQRGRFTIVPA